MCISHDLVHLALQQFIYLSTSMKQFRFLSLPVDNLPVDNVMELSV